MVEEGVREMREPEGAQERLARAMEDINARATDYALAYRVLHRVQMENRVDEETFSWVVSCLRELVAHCELYLRDNPRERQVIELIIERVLEERKEQGEI